MIEWNSSATALPGVGEVVIGFAPDWIDEDFNPLGLSECFRMDEGNWVRPVWNNCHDCYDTDLDAMPPTHWMRLRRWPEPEERS